MTPLHTISPHMNMLARVVLAMSMFTLVQCGRPSGEGDATRSREPVPTSHVTFLNDDGSDRVRVDVAIADDDRERTLGLMFVTEMGPSEGMLFIFEEEEPRSFWMANTPLPLDIMFLDSDLRIVRIHRNTPPFSQEQFRSDLPARYVVEVHGGFTITHDIREGMRIRVG